MKLHRWGLCILILAFLSLLDASKKTKITWKESKYTKEDKGKLETLGYAVKVDAVLEPVTHYLYSSIDGKYTTVKGYEKDDLQDSLSFAFYRSASRGAALYLKILAAKKITPEKNLGVLYQPSVDELVAKPLLKDVIDLVNFFMFVLLPENSTNFKLTDLCFRIEADAGSDLHKKLFTFFSSYYVVEKNAKDFVSSNDGYIAIHLRTKPAQKTYLGLGKTGRGLWLGNKHFKSFSFTKDQNILYIQPHSGSSAKPQKTCQGGLVLSEADLLSAAKHLTGDTK